MTANPTMLGTCDRTHRWESEHKGLHPHWANTPFPCHNWKPQAEPLNPKQIPFSSLVNTIGICLNNHLLDMKPEQDDSMVGFNEAWDIVRGVLKKYTVAEPLRESQPECEDCRRCAAHAYSDATTLGFFHDKCEKHRPKPPVVEDDGPLSVCADCGMPKCDCGVEGEGPRRGPHRIFANDKTWDWCGGYGGYGRCRVCDGEGSEMEQAFLNAMVRDFPGLGSRPKSEVRRRILEFANRSTR